MKRLFSILCLCALMISCGSDETPAPTLVGKWRFAGYLVENKLDVFNLAFPAYFVTLELTDKQTSGVYEATGQAPINTYSATYTYNAAAGQQGAMTVKLGTITQLAGPSDAINYETKYLERLQKASRFDISSPKKLFIYLSSPQGEVLVYEKL
ncbi:MAG: META domain-containing protein [Spirosomataceae bacterium]